MRWIPLQDFLLDVVKVHPLLLNIDFLTLLFNHYYYNNEIVKSIPFYLLTLPASSSHTFLIIFRRSQKQNTFTSDLSFLWFTQRVAGDISPYIFWLSNHNSSEQIIIENIAIRISWFWTCLVDKFFSIKINL